MIRCAAGTRQHAVQSPSSLRFQSAPATGGREPRHILPTTRHTSSLGHVTRGDWLCKHSLGSPGPDALGATATVELGSWQQQQQPTVNLHGCEEQGSALDPCSSGPSRPNFRLHASSLEFVYLGRRDRSPVCRVCFSTMRSAADYVTTWWGRDVRPSLPFAAAAASETLFDPGRAERNRMLPSAHHH
jgi:hypothetical protein